MRITATTNAEVDHVLANAKAGRLRIHTMAMLPESKSGWVFDVSDTFFNKPLYNERRGAEAADHYIARPPKQRPPWPKPERWMSALKKKVNS